MPSSVYPGTTFHSKRQEQLSGGSIKILTMTAIPIDHFFATIEAPLTEWSG